MKNDTDLGNGYEYQANRGDNLHIRRNGKVVIDSAIIDIIKEGPYIVGIRLPADHLDCQGANKIRINNTPYYFIIETHTHEQYQFDDYDKFIAQWDAYELNKLPKLDYSRFESTWQTYSAYYKNTDFSSCTTIPHQ